MSNDTKTSFNILIIEDDRALLHLITILLKAFGYSITGMQNWDLEIIKQHNEKDSLILLDYKLANNLTADKVISNMHENNINIPFIIMTGFGDEKIAVNMMKLGARDYLVKDMNFNQQLPNVVNRIVNEIINKNLLETTLTELQHSKDKYELLFNSVYDAIYVIRLEGPDFGIAKIIEANRTAYENLDMTKKELLGLSVSDFDFPLEDNDVIKSYETVHYKKSGTSFPVEIKGNTLKFGDKYIYKIFIVRDITVRKKNEKEIEAYQKYLELLVEQRTKKLNETNSILKTRVNELACLFSIAKIFENKSIPLDEAITEVANSIPNAFKQSNKTYARIKLMNKVFTSDDFKETKIFISREIKTDTENIGSLEVFIDDGKEDKDIKSFSEEEILLIDSIRERIENTIILNNKEKELQQSYNKLIKINDYNLSTLNKLNIGIAVISSNSQIVYISKLFLDILGLSNRVEQPVSWQQIFPFSEKDKKEIAELIKDDKKGEEDILVNFRNHRDTNFWLEIHADANPDNPDETILFARDVTEINALRTMLDIESRFHNIIGKSEPMQVLFKSIKEIAKVDWTVLIHGETGSGKELVARAIHDYSARNNKPFIAVNCAELTDSLLTSQLFGHTKGAFTGAVDDKKGLFEAANQGTIFLDEIGDVSLENQKRFLRVLEEKEVLRLGDTIPRKIDVRIIAATNKNLADEVEKNNFRADLLYRIMVNRINVPPLRERGDDILLLADFFLNQSIISSGMSKVGFANETLVSLKNHPWYGNVRELRSAIEYSLINCSGDIIKPENLPPEIIKQKSETTVPSVDNQTNPLEEVKQHEYNEIIDTLKKTRGNRSKAAQLLGMSRSTLYKKIKEMNSQ